MQPSYKSVRIPGWLLPPEEFKELMRQRKLRATCWRNNCPE